MSSVLIFRDTILPLSETFIQQQAEALTRYRFTYAGLYPAHPSLVPAQDAVLLQPDSGLLSRMRGAAYRRFGLASAFRAPLKDLKPALVHAHFAPDGVHAIALSRMLKAPLIVTLHGYDVTVEDMQSVQYQAVWNEASLFLCVSEFIREAALKRGFPASKLRVQYIGVDEDRFRVTETVPEIPVGHNILFVGRLVPKKGCQFLIKAILRVQADLPDAQLTIIGDGPLRSSLESEARASGVRARFLGAQDASVIREHLQRTSVFCVPSVTASNGDSEGFGIVFLEAQAMGVPVVSFRHGGIVEAVADGKTGLLAPEGDVDELARLLLTYLQDEACRRAAGSAARERVMHEFSLRRRTAELEAIYDEVVLTGSQ